STALSPVTFWTVDNRCSVTGPCSSADTVSGVEVLVIQDSVSVVGLYLDKRNRHGDVLVGHGKQVLVTAETGQAGGAAVDLQRADLHFVFGVRSNGKG